MHEATSLRSEITNDQSRLIAAHLRTLEESCMRLLELFRPFDSSLLRRQPLPHEKAEDLHRMVARLRSRGSEAAWDLGLPRAHQDARWEAASLVATMHENLGELLHLRDGNGVTEDLAGYLEDLVKDFRHIVADIDRRVGKSISKAAEAGQNRREA